MDTPGHQVNSLAFQGSPVGIPLFPRSRRVTIPNSPFKIMQNRPEPKAALLAGHRHRLLPNKVSAFDLQVIYGGIFQRLLISGACQERLRRARFHYIRLH